MNTDRIPDLEFEDDKQRDAFLKFMIAAYDAPYILIGPDSDLYDEAFMRLERYAIRRSSVFKSHNFAE